MATAKDYVLHTFHKTQVNDKFWGEGANFGDFNHDGKMDLVSGPYWYEGPDFKKRHEYSPATSRKSSGGSAQLKKKTPDGKEEIIEGFEGALGTNNAYSDTSLPSLMILTRTVDRYPYHGFSG
jgi:hypothetical protein